MNFLTQIPTILKNKYLLSVVAFLVWMLFFDKNDIFSQIERKSYLNELSKNETHQSEQINETQKELSNLKTSAATIEKYAREKYLMKKDNEDLFIINSSTKEQ